MSDEAFCDLPSGIRLCYRDAGSGDAMLLVTGLSYQLVHWPGEIVAGLRAAGHRVVTFDNRDSGRSSFTEGDRPTFLQKLLRRPPSSAYDLADMAEDTIGLLDHLGIERAHLVGMSMGGMIAQTVAARFPDRVLSLTSIISTTGARSVGQPSPGVIGRLALPAAKTKTSFVSGSLKMLRAIEGRSFRSPEGHRAEIAARSWDRADGRVSAGTERQMAAIFKSGDRTSELRRVRAPTLVIHGDRDPLVNSSGGAATARAIRGARLVTIPGMGHELALSLSPKLVRLIADHAAAARTSMPVTGRMADPAPTTPSG